MSSKNQELPEREGENELTLKEVKQTQPTSLRELWDEFVLFTPALIVLAAKFDVDPVAYAAGQTQIADVFSITSPQPLLQLPGLWGSTLWAVPREVWPQYLNALGRLVIQDPTRRRMAKIMYHELQVPDVLSKSVVDRPHVAVTAFAVDANFGYFYLSSEPGPLPRLVQKQPLAETVQEAAKIFSVRSPRDAGQNSVHATAHR